MIIGVDFFMGNCFDGNISIGNINCVDIKNILLNEIKIDTDTTNIGYNPQFQNWSGDTILKYEGMNLDFESGNVRLGGLPIEYLRVKKRKIDDLTWSTYANIPYDSTQVEYNWSDYFVESLESYEYTIVPVGSQNVEGDYDTKTVGCEYEDIWILGSDNQQFHLLADIQKGDIQVISPSIFVETLGSRYPYEISQGSVNYRKTSVKARLISDSTLSGNNGYDNGIDRKAEKALRNSLYAFLTNKKPKVYKDSEGDYILASIKADSVKITQDNSLSRQIADISFDLYEIGDVNDVSVLKNVGLLD